MSTSGGSRAIAAAFLSNLGVALAKFIGFAITGASSMLSEAIHSVADTGNQALLLLGRSRASREPDAEHQFGYGRERFFWAFVVAVVLFVLGAVFAVYEGIHKIRHPEPLENPLVAITILVVAMSLEGLSLRTAAKESRSLKRSDSWWEFIRRAKVPELPVVLLEDAGALSGLVVALAAVGVTIVTDDPRYDGVGSIVIGLILGCIAVLLCVEMKGLLIGESMTPQDRVTLRRTIENSPGVVRIIHERTEYIGAEQVLLAAKVEFESAMSMPQVSAAIDVVEANVRDALSQVTLIYIEPDVFHPPGVDGIA